MNLMPSEPIPEIDVLIATSLWLWNRRVTPVQFSIAKGQGIDFQANKTRLIEVLDDAGISDKLQNFVASGPDIVAVSAKEYWQIECKGAGTGKPSTQRNNFDRAIASVVSYFIDKVEGFPVAFSEVKPVLGLALPRTQAYLSLLNSRVPVALRKQLNLWVLLYDQHDSVIQAFAPDENW